MAQEPFVIRPVTEDDFDWLFNFRSKVDLGFTSLPHNREYLTNRLATVCNSFAENIPPQQRIYLFVREQLDSGERVGIAGVQACAGFNTIFYNYEVSSITQHSREMDLQFDHQVLNLVENFQTATELISFWVDPEKRGQKYGKPLSYSRLLFLAQFANLFGKTLIAEIRGVCDEHGKTPFWDTVIRPFFGMEFVTADYLTMSTDKQFIADLMPKLPIYVDLLPKEAQQLIGVAHDTALPARKFLENQGLKYRNYIDIFDAGPLLSADLTDVKLVKDSSLKTVVAVEANIQDGRFVIIGNVNLGMRMTTGIIQEQENNVVVSKDIAEILQVDVGSEVRYAEI